jgi:hypothetical protein
VVDDKGGGDREHEHDQYPQASTAGSALPDHRFPVLSPPEADVEELKLMRVSRA